MSLETPNLRKALDTLRAAFFDLGDPARKFDEGKHQRDEQGRFTFTDAPSSASSSQEGRHKAYGKFNTMHSAEGSLRFTALRPGQSGSVYPGYIKLSPNEKGGYGVDHVSGPPSTWSHKDFDNIVGAAEHLKTWAGIDIPTKDLKDHFTKPQKSVEEFDLVKYIRHEGDQWTVYSEAGKPMGTYDSEAGAKKRLQQIEYFKHRKSIDDIRNLGASLTKTETQRIIDTAISSPPVKTPTGERPPSPQEDSGLTDGVSPIIVGVRPPKLQAQRFPGNTASEGTGSTGGGIGPNVGAYKT